MTHTSFDVSNTVDYSPSKSGLSNRRGSAWASHLTDQGVTCAAIPTDADQRTVGELIATATGDDRNRVRHSLLGLDVILPDGHAPARFGGENMKDVAGYDTKRLFIGSHDAFGTTSAAIFKISVHA
jgi:glycolate oxidase